MSLTAPRYTVIVADAQGEWVHPMFKVPTEDRAWAIRIAALVGRSPHARARVVEADE